MRLHLLHDCTINGAVVRHREAIDYREIKLNDGNYRLSGTRCDGHWIEAIGQWRGRVLIASNTNAPPSDPDRYERNMWEAGREWISRNHGPWEPLIEFPDQPEAVGSYESDLFGGMSA